MSSERIHDGSPVSDPDTKTALLCAGHNDTLRVDGHGEMTVVDRTDPYFGPKITLHNEADGLNYRVVPAGFDNDPELWRAVTGDDGEFIKAWAFVEHVALEVTDVGQADVCECGEVPQSLREKRSAVVGVCPH